MPRRAPHVEPAAAYTLAVGLQRQELKSLEARTAKDSVSRRQNARGAYHITLSLARARLFASCYTIRLRPMQRSQSAGSRVGPGKLAHKRGQRCRHAPQRCHSREREADIRTRRPTRHSTGRPHATAKCYPAAQAGAAECQVVGRTARGVTEHSQRASSLSRLLDHSASSACLESAGSRTSSRTSARTADRSAGEHASRSKSGDSPSPHSTAPRATTCA